MRFWPGVAEYEGEFMEIDGKDRGLPLPPGPQQPALPAPKGERGRSLLEPQGETRRGTFQSRDSDQTARPAPTADPEVQGLRRTFLAVARLAFEAKGGGEIDREKLEEELTALSETAARLGVPHQDRIEAALEEVRTKAADGGGIDLSVLHRIVLHLAHFARNHPGSGPSVQPADPNQATNGPSGETPATDAAIDIVV